MQRTIIRGGTSLDTLTTPGMYLCVGVDETRDNAPFANMLLIVTESSDRVYQKAIAYSTLAEATRQYWDNWKPWTKLPTRSEVDALEARISALEN